MKNDFLKISSKRILFSTVVASALMAGNPQRVFADAQEGKEVQTVMQVGTVKGQIVDVNGESIIGASVLVKETNTGVISDIDGNFIINAPANATLLISYVGYQTQTIKLGGKTSIRVTMQEDAELLDEVVVVGYGTQKKASLTSAITQIRGDETLKNRTANNATLALQGAVPGLTITRSSTRPGNEGAAMQIRGDISVNGGSPMILIDGMFASLGELNAMEPNDIENISVLKDASAAIYGARSSNGVVLVTTKRGKQGKAQVSYNGSFSKSIDGIKLPLTTNQQFMDMFYEAQYNDFSAQYPELVGQVDENGYPVLEGVGGFWWLLVVAVTNSPKHDFSRCKSVIYKFLSRVTKSARDKNGTKPRKNKVKNTSPEISLVEYLCFVCKGTNLSLEKRGEIPISLIHNSFSYHCTPNVVIASDFDLKQHGLRKSGVKFCFAL